MKAVHPFASALAVMGLGVLALSLPGNSALVPLALAVALVASAGGPALRRAVAIAAPVAAVTVLVYALALHADPLARWGPLAVGRDGLAFGAVTAARLAAFLCAGVWFLHAADAREALRLAHGLPWPSLALAARYAPDTALDARRIREAQGARGLAGTRAALRTETLLVPVFVLSLRRARLAARALSAAAFGSGPRTRLHPLAWRARDSWWGAAGIALAVAGILVRGGSL